MWACATVRPQYCTASLVIIRGWRLRAQHGCFVSCTLRETTSEARRAASCTCHAFLVPLGQIRQDSPQRPLQVPRWEEWRPPPMPQAGAPRDHRARSDSRKVRSFTSLHVCRRSRCIAMNCPIQSAQGSLSPSRSRHACVVCVSHALSCQRSYRGRHDISRTLCWYPSKLTVAARRLFRLCYFAWQVHSSQRLPPRQAHLLDHGLGPQHEAHRPQNFD